MMIPRLIAYWVQAQDPNMLAQILMWQAMSSVMAAVRGGVFTYSNALTHMWLYRRLASTILFEMTMTDWEVSITHPELLKTLLSHVIEAAHHVGLAVNVINRSLSSIFAVTFILLPISSELYLTVVGLALVQAVILHFSTRAYEHVVQRARADRAALDKVSHDIVTQFVITRFCSLERTYMSVVDEKLAILIASTSAESVAYARMQLVLQNVPQICDIAFKAAAISYVGLQGAMFLQCVAYYDLVRDTLSSIKEALLSLSRQGEALDMLHKYHVTRDTKNSKSNSENSDNSKHSKQRPKSIQKPENDTHSQDKCYGHDHRGFPLWDFEEVTFAYPTRPDTPVLDRFSLSIYPGDKIALCAPSGTGKSTLVKLMLGMYPASKGRIRLPPPNLKLAVVPQDAVYFADKTLRENLTLFLPPSSCTTQNCNRSADASNASNAMTDTLQNEDKTTELLLSILKRLDLMDLCSQLDSKQANLSGGQRQRVALARAILADRSVLILDEPSSALDNDTENHIFNVLDAMFLKDDNNRQRYTIILITHSRKNINPAFRCVEL